MNHDMLPASFLDAMACVPSAVTVIATTHEGSHAGLVATSVCSLSADPPTLLVCVNKSASAHAALLAAGTFSVNVLTASQGGFADRFVRTKGAARFATADWHLRWEGAPTLHHAMASFHCVLTEVTDGHTHSCIFGRVVQAHMAADSDATGLIWHQRGYGTHARLQRAAEPVC